MSGAMIRSRVEEFYGHQYWTTTGSQDKIWWPHEGTGYCDTLERATQLAKESGYAKVRVVKIVRSMEFFDTIEQEGR